MKKRRRTARACDYCHQRSIRCIISEGDAQQRCLNCVDFDQPCTVTRAIKRRGPKPKDRTIENDGSLAASNGRVQPDIARSMAVATDVWCAPPIAAHALVVDLVEIYFEVVYPIFPLFHRPSYKRRVARGEYQSRSDLFAMTMAVCALSSARVRDAALFNPFWSREDLADPPSEIFYNAAIDNLPHEDAPMQSLNLMRTYAFLALTAIQHGNIRQMQAYLGRYHTLVELDGLHDESNWPSDLGNIELEERRRLFWSMYTLDVFSSIVWSGIIRVREQQCRVQYTTELDDLQFDDYVYRFNTSSPISGPSPTGSASGSAVSWLRGWNATTDLWRMLEHATSRLQSDRASMKTFLERSAGFDSSSPAAAIEEQVDKLYQNLPACFKDATEVTCDPILDCYGFQAANITATVQLLRMMLLASKTNSIEQRCKVVSEVVDVFMRIPVAYLRAISSPLLHHLAGIGSVLGEVLGKPFNEYQYQEVRTVLLSLAQLLENLNHGLHSTEVVRKLRNLVLQIDAHMISVQHQAASIDASSTTVAPELSLQHVPRSSEWGATEHCIQLPPDLLIDWPWKSGFMH